MTTDIYVCYPCGDEVATLDMVGCLADQEYAAARLKEKGEQGRDTGGLCDRKRILPRKAAGRDGREESLMATCMRQHIDELVRGGSLGGSRAEVVKQVIA